MKELWNIKNWNYFKTYDWAYQLFGETIYLSLDRDNKFFSERLLNIKIKEEKLDNENVDLTYSIEKFAPAKLIIYCNKKLYLIPNKDFSIRDEFNGTNNENFDLHLIKKSKNQNWIFKNLNRREIKDGYNDIIKFNKSLEEYKYKGRIYTFFLINRLKIQIKKQKQECLNSLAKEIKINEFINKYK